MGPGDKACWTHGAGEGSTHHQPAGSRGHLAGLALCLLCPKAQRTAVCGLAGRQPGPSAALGPAHRSHGGPAGRQLCLSPGGARTGPRPLLPAPSSLEAPRTEAALVPGGAGATCGWGVPILSGQPGLPTPTAPAPRTPGLVSSRKATGLQGRPACEPERFTGLPRAQGSLLSGQAPAGQAAWPRAGICLPPPPTRTGL